MRTVFREQSSKKTVTLEEQIMSKEKYPYTFSRKIEAIEFIVLQTLFQYMRRIMQRFLGFMNNIKEVMNDHS